MTLLFADHRSLEPPKRRALLARRDRYTDFVRAQVEQGQVDRSIRGDADPALAGRALLEALRGTDGVAAASSTLILSGLAS
jgi:hypothetical protein